MVVGVYRCAYVWLSLHSNCYIACVADNNEVEIVRSHGLEPVVNGAAVAAEGLTMNDMKTDKEVALLEELGTQCARALRNLSVNRKYFYYYTVCSVCGYNMHYATMDCDACTAYDLIPVLTDCPASLCIAANKGDIVALGAIRHLQVLMNYPNDRIAQQVSSRRRVQ